MKFIRIFLLVLIIAGITLLMTQKFWVNDLTQWILEKEDEIQATSTPKIEDRKVRKIGSTFESLGINPTQIKSFNNQSKLSFAGPDGLHVSFEGSVIQARNPGSHIYLNDKEIGTVGGGGVIEGYFSEDSRYFFFSTYSICGAECIGKQNYKIDLASPNIILDN
jgi:hypothetical protein